MPISTLFVGIDVSLKTNQVCPINFNQDVFFNKKFDNSPSGTEKLIHNILDVLIIHQELSKVIFCLEATNVYHVHLASALAMDPRLSAHDCKVYAENAKSIENYKRTFWTVKRLIPKMLSSVLTMPVLESVRNLIPSLAIKKLHFNVSLAKENTLQSS